MDTEKPVEKPYTVTFFNAVDVPDSVAAAVMSLLAGFDPDIRVEDRGGF